MKKKFNSIVWFVLLLQMFSFVVSAIAVESEIIFQSDETVQPMSELTDYRYAGDDSGRWPNNCGPNLHNVDAFSDLKLP